MTSTSAAYISADSPRKSTPALRARSDPHMASPLPPLESRTLSSGLARRTLKNLDFIKKNASSTEAHPVTQVVNSLLGLLVFPVEKEKLFLATFSKVKFKDPSNLS